MTILDRTRGNRIRIDANQLADEIAKRLPDLDRTRDQATNVVHDAADSARHQIDRAAEIARVIRGDIAHSAGKVQADNPVDEIGQRIRAVASTAGIRALIVRLERELPDVDRDRYHRAYSRGRAQARSKYLVAGLVAGVGVGVVAAVFLDPKHGGERRGAIANRASSLTRGLGRQASGKAKLATDKARGIAIERGVVKPGPPVEPVEPVADTAPVAATAAVADGPVTDPASTRWEAPPAPDGGAVQPLAAAAADVSDATATEGLVVTDAVDLAGDRGATRSIHG